MNDADVVEIDLTKGKSALVNRADFGHLAQWSWHLCDKDGRLYAYRGTKVNGKTVHVAMHRVVVGAVQGQHVDHKNGDGLDNRRCNLRVCTNSQNQMNRVKHTKHATSKYKGVSWHKAAGKWSARIQKNGTPEHLGVFEDDHDAARAYDRRARELFGPFARTNFPG